MKKFVVVAGGTLLALYGVKKAVLFVWIREGVATYNYINKLHGIDPATGKLALEKLYVDVLANRDRHIKTIRSNHKAVRTHLVDEYLSNVAYVRAQQKRNFRAGNIDKATDIVMDEFERMLRDKTATRESISRFITQNFGISAKDQHQINEAYFQVRKNNDG